MEQGLLRFVPIWHFHEDERYYPIAFPQYLAEARLRGPDGLDQSTLGFAEWVNLAPVDIQRQSTLYLTEGPRAQVMNEPRPPTSASLGDRPMYVSSFQPDDHNLYFNYILFFANNPALKVVCGCALFGQHDADIEHIQVHVKDNELYRVYYSKHAGGNWVMRDQLQLDGDRVHVYVARDSHACFERAGFQWRWGGVVPDWTSSKGLVMNSLNVLLVDGVARYRGTWGDGAVSGLPDKAWFQSPEVDGEWRCH